MSVKKELEAIIKKGKTAVHNGVRYTSVESLPSDAELSKGDKEKEETARRNIKAELRRLAEELAMLDDEKDAKESKAPARKAESSAPEKASEQAKESAGDKSAVKAEKPAEEAK